MPSPVEILQQPVVLPFSGKTASNRFMKAAMSERLATYFTSDPLDRGKPTDALIKVYEQWGKGGYGIILSGNLIVDKGHLEGEGNIIIDRTLPSSYLEEYKEMARVAKAHGSLFLAQLSHGGRQTADRILPHPLGPSDIQLAPSQIATYGKPTPLTKEGIKNVVSQFAYAAGVVHEAGFDGIQTHAAHGYLLAQFLSPRVNNRTDEYGGSLENRSRILLEIIAAIKERVNDPSFIISVKLNSQDFLDGGFSEDDSISLSVALQKAGVDLIEISGGSIENPSFEHKRESTKRREAFFVEFAEKLRPHITTSLLAVTGGFRSAAKMAEAVTEGWTNVIGIGRPLTFEPLLGSEIISGEKTGASDSTAQLPMLYSVFASVLQIADLSKGVPPTDYSKEENLAALKALLQSYGGTSSEKS
ncbi:hypothetical protein PLICRDRAFT_55611 [Plicaturopsis crispa FD-325 SS-3]|nr:hypothetical protein PLICRDRAFT_55611 [Plicaturopsis crispa FD-325 SS-3]